MKPNKSLKIFKLFLTKSQLPYEMVYILGKSMQMVAQEVGDYYDKPANKMDADAIVPYLLYVMILGVAEVNA